MPFVRNMEKYGAVGQATDDNTIRRMRIACWTTKATDTYSEYVILIFLHYNNDSTNAANFCVIRTLLVLPYIYIYIQGVPRVKVTTSGECSLC